METPKADFQYAPEKCASCDGSAVSPGARGLPCYCCRGAKEKPWFNSHRGRVPRVRCSGKRRALGSINIVRFVPGEVGKIQRSSRHTPRLDQWELVL